MSAPAIEARSLSSITALASNPPAYPRNPTHARNQPLVLYIARVPGSKDVFLSPMKPRQKVVTAEDITSSLYFLHVELPEDANLVAPPQFQEPNYQQGPTATNGLPIPAVQRKALPSSANQPARKPVSSTLAPIDNFGSRQNMYAGDYSRNSALLAPDVDRRRSHESYLSPRENQQEAHPINRSPERIAPAGTSLTLIRRDPSSGAQWNVARIDDPSMAEISSSASFSDSPKRRMGAPIFIDITNPGYSKFLESDSVGRPSSTNNSTNPATTSQQSTPEPPLHSRGAQNLTVFRRRLWMEGVQYSNGGFGHRQNSSYDVNSGRPDSKGSHDGRMERASFDSRPPAPSPSFLTPDGRTYSTIQASDRQTSFRGYVFTSPWNGRCEFITGGGGGSLKCRHIVPGLQGAPPAAMSVSELRFNLPGSSIPSTPRGEESSKRTSFFHRGRHSRNNSSLSVNRDEIENAQNPTDRLDLSLGQELAGGGFGGKQAKLGKIIIDDEGLKMVDLLVAANLALWWRAYEKATSQPRTDRGSF
ncbi:hypothetical protein DE146DRAFT_331996 [Phaeosphaeria sp. MPI-PUGE-AT-0046c]|nr:hypothetical protein DE146DRAFT_331996 [Phaeosphaeria sp. MPI-PUGE-AT-0046c]